MGPIKSATKCLEGEGGKVAIWAMLKSEIPILGQTGRGSTKSFDKLAKMWLRFKEWEYICKQFFPF